MAKWVALPESNLGPVTDFHVWVVVSSGGGGGGGRRGGKDVWMLMP